MINKGYVGVPHAQLVAFYKAMLTHDRVVQPEEIVTRKRKHAVLECDLGELESLGRVSATQHHHPDSTEIRDSAASVDTHVMQPPDVNDQDDIDHALWSGSDSEVGEVFASLFGEPIQPNEEPVIAESAEAQDVGGIAEQGGEADELASHRWGQYRFTLRRSTLRFNVVAYAWECHCPYHAKSSRTMCKKSLTIQQCPPTEWRSESEKTLRSLKQWANDAVNHNRQRDHIIVPALPCPLTSEILEAQRPSWPDPPPTIHTDMQLDGLSQ